MNKLIAVILLVACAQAEAGEWFKTVEISVGLGTQYYKCEYDNCRGARIGDDPIGKFSISQSIYDTDKFRVHIEWNHYSSIPNDNSSNDPNKWETPVDYFGVGLSSRFDWY